MGVDRFINKGTKLGGGSGGDLGRGEGEKKNHVPPPKPTRNNMKEMEETCSVDTGEMAMMKLMKGGNLQTVNAYLLKEAVVNFDLFEPPPQSSPSSTRPFAGIFDVSNLGSALTKNGSWIGKARLTLFQLADVKIIRRGYEVVGDTSSADEEELRVGLKEIIKEGRANTLQVTLTKVPVGGGCEDKVDLKLEGNFLRRIGQVFGTDKVQITVELEQPSCAASSRGTSFSSDNVDFRADVVDSPKENLDLAPNQIPLLTESPEASFSKGASSLDAAVFNADYSVKLNASGGEEEEIEDGPRSEEADKSKEDQVDGLHEIITRQLLRFSGAATGHGKMYRTNEMYRICLLEGISRAKDLPLLVSDTDGLVYCQSTLDISRSWLKSWYVPPGFNGRYTKVAKVNVIVAVTNTEPTAPAEELGVDTEEAKGILAVNKKLLEGEIQTNMVILVGNGEVAVKCYSGFLAAQSEVLKAMLRFKPDRIIMDDLSVEGVRALLAFLYYRGTIGPMGRMDICVELLKAGHKYRIACLEREMKDIILGHKKKQTEDWFEVEATLALFFFANGLDERFWELREKAVATLKMKAKQVVASDAYSRLFEEDPSAAKELASVFLTMLY